MAGIVTHYSTPDAGPVLPVVLLIFGVMLTTQLIDNYLFQPFIYSSSVKAHPLEIFIVILIAGYVGGVIGMLVAIPAYTVIRVFAGEFLSHFKIVQRLTKSLKGTGDGVPEEAGSPDHKAK
jgi:predicted PurR-regulated permease PerM